jgi:hypothetical protein
MFWKISRYRTGELVEVCSKDEILATLDERGSVDGLPFMPEMLRFCGRRFTVRAVAHKTCETARQTWKGRRLRATVHLADLRCDGSDHGGCEAACTLFWKDAWLKPVEAAASPANTNGKLTQLPIIGNEPGLFACTQSPEPSADGETCYRCQATQLYEATEPLAWWDARQYIADIVTGNRSIARVLMVLWLSLLRAVGRVARYVPLVGHVYSAFSELMHRLLTGRGAPSLFKHTKPCIKTPTGRLDLQPGELVRVKSKSEIEATLDSHGYNRGLSFDPEEMAPYCGGTFRVRASVTKIVDEMTGKMRRMKHPCIMLEGVVCQSLYARCRINCPRAVPSYWRELWLERVNAEPPCDVSANGAHSNGEVANEPELVAAAAVCDEAAACHEAAVPAGMVR